jgi:uncharacterized coiled-coil DUF342 family protein
MKRMINNKIVDMTETEIAEHNATVENVKTQKQANKDAKETKENLKVSAKNKLMNGEALTEDEANVMVGL